MIFNFHGEIFSSGHSRCGIIRPHLGHFFSTRTTSLIFCGFLAGVDCYQKLRLGIKRALGNIDSGLHLSELLLKGVFILRYHGFAKFDVQ